MSVSLKYTKLNILILTKLKKKVDQHTGGKWLIHGTKRHKDNRLQSLAQQDFIQKIYI